jgi:3'-phosphoadenosine 5'-phosphosulfate sulfotransferase (PAPS reductase)/FAD synthetase
VTAELGRKQGIRDQAAWQAAFTAAAELWPPPKLARLVDQTATAIAARCAGRNAAVAWSGGKDSLALAHVARLAGVTECVLAISDLEYPAFLRWVTDNMPDGLTVLSTGQDLDWLARNPRMLFPQGADGSRWFTIVNHRGQEQYYKQNRLDVLLLGRRHADGNYTGPVGQVEYTNARKVCRYSPIANWPHEAVFALIGQQQIALPPCYGWPRGFQVGTGSWPARQWTESHDHGWAEVWQIDPGVVRGAAARLPEAADWLARRGRS